MEDLKLNEDHDQNGENEVEKYPNISTLSNDKTTLKISSLNNEPSTNLTQLGHTNHGFINDEPLNDSQKIYTKNINRLEEEGTETGNNEESFISKDEGTSNEVSKVLRESIENEQNVAKQNNETKHVSKMGTIDTKAEAIKISNQNNFKGKISKKGFFVYFKTCLH